MFFFFQAEDGIRDRTVTGVQTCALPISAHRSQTALSAHSGSVGRPSPPWRNPEAQEGRSEERRVGKECRSRRSLYRQMKYKKLTCEELAVDSVQSTTIKQNTAS